MQLIHYLFNLIYCFSWFDLQDKTFSITQVLHVHQNMRNNKKYMICTIKRQVRQSMHLVSRSSKVLIYCYHQKVGLEWKKTLMTQIHQSTNTQNHFISPPNRSSWALAALTCCCCIETRFGAIIVAWKKDGFAIKKNIFRVKQKQKTVFQLCWIKSGLISMQLHPPTNLPSPEMNSLKNTRS